MFTFLTPTPAAVMPNTTTMDANPINKHTAIAHNQLAKKSATQGFLTTRRLGAALLTGALLLSGCQPQSVSDEKNSEKVISEDDKAGVQSASAAARIKQFQPLYVTQMQALQRRLQAEYEALQAADMPNSDNTLLTTNKPTAATTPTETEVKAKTETPPNSDSDNKQTTTKAATEEINTSTAVGERDLEVLKRISLEPQKPELLTEAQIIERYQQAMQALYEPASKALSAQESDTLINITTLSPQLFEHPEIAQRVSIKSPALARLIVQHQVGQQIQAQQSLDMQQMKLSQQQEFETLMLKFNDTIEDYDKQIAKYEQTLTEFQE